MIGQFLQLPFPQRLACNSSKSLISSRDIFCCFIQTLRFQQCYTRESDMYLKKAPSLADLVSPSLVVAPSENRFTWLKHTGCYNCASPRCDGCNYIDVPKTFKSVVTEKVYTVKQYINCNTSHVVYLVTCTACHVQYVGSTVCKFKV